MEGPGRTHGLATGRTASVHSDRDRSAVVGHSRHSSLDRAPALDCLRRWPTAAAARKSVV